MNEFEDLVGMTGDEAKNTLLARGFRGIYNDYKPDLCKFQK